MLGWMGLEGNWSIGSLVVLKGRIVLRFWRGVGMYGVVKPSVYNVDWLLPNTARRVTALWESKKRETVGAVMIVNEHGWRDTRKSGWMERRRAHHKTGAWIWASWW